MGLRRLLLRRSRPASTRASGESRDLVAAEPEKAKALGRTLEAWDREVIPAAFPGAGARQKPKAKTAAVPKPED